MVDFISHIEGDIQEEIPRIPTSWKSLNDILSGGFPRGRIIEIYGASQIGKTSLALRAYNKIFYFDIARKLYSNYLEKCNINSITVDQSSNNEKLFEKIGNLLDQDILIVIDDLTRVCTISTDSERSRWLCSRFSRLHRILPGKLATVLVLNQIRQDPLTSRIYNPSPIVMDPALRIKMHTAEKLSNGRVVYLDVEKSYWSEEGSRTTLFVSKENIIEYRTAYKQCGGRIQP